MILAAERLFCQQLLNIGRESAKRIAEEFTGAIGEIIINQLS